MVYSDRKHSQVLKKRDNSFLLLLYGQTLPDTRYKAKQKYTIKVRLLGYIKKIFVVMTARMNCATYNQIHFCHPNYVNGFDVCVLGQIKFN